MAKDPFLEESSDKREAQKVRSSKELVAEILNLDQEGFGLTAISRKLGISRGSVYGVLSKARQKKAGL
jgi:hypothetical protein